MDGPRPESDAIDDPPRDPDAGDGPRRDRDPSEALADRYRRHTYRLLCEVDSAVSVARLARQVVARTSEKPPDAVSLDEQKRMYTALDRTHLPALEAAELVERDHAGDTVARVDLDGRPTDAVRGDAEPRPDVPSRPG